MEGISELKSCLQPANENPSYSTTYGDMSNWTKKFYPIQPTNQPQEDNTKVPVQKNNEPVTEKEDKWFEKTTSRNMTNWTRFHQNECVKKAEKPTDSYVQPLDTHFLDLMNCYWKCDGVHDKQTTAAPKSELTYKPNFEEVCLED